MFTIVNGIQVDLKDYINNADLIQRLENDDSFVSAVSFNFEKAFVSVDDEFDELSGDEILEMVVNCEIDRRVEQMKSGLDELIQSADSRKPEQNSLIQHETKQEVGL